MKIPEFEFKESGLRFEPSFLASMKDLILILPIAHQAEYVDEVTYRVVSNNLPVVITDAEINAIVRDKTPKPEQFEESTNAPKLSCNNCGNYAQAKFTYSIPLHAIGMDGDCMIVCCSKQCVDKFCAGPNTLNYITGLIVRITSIRQ